MISKDKLTAMLELQNTLNMQVNPNWLTANYPWHRAIMVESVEALEHYGWKWWKQQEPALDQVRMELVDIWHFILSMALVNTKGDSHEASKTILAIFYDPEKPTDKDTLILFDLMAGYAAEGKICVPAFVHLLQELDVSWDDLYHLYVAKNVLNLFRQAHGYKTGTYRKDWDGVEDNVMLAGLIVAMPDATPDDLYQELRGLYDTVLYNAR